LLCQNLDKICPRPRFVVLSEFDEATPHRTQVTKGFFYQKWSSVFNLDCIDDSGADVKIQDIIDLPESTPDNPDTPVPSIDRFLAAIGGNVEYGGDRAAYSPTTDKIVLPHWKQFKSAAAGYATAIHEYAHWTGHQTRLDRPGITEFAGFGSKSYAREELIAEISSAMLTAQLYPEYSGVELEHHAAYLSSWLSGLKTEPEAFFTALTQAQKACKLLVELGSRDIVLAPVPAPIAAPQQLSLAI
jgi:antirestriction protein ArdC